MPDTRAAKSSDYARHARRLRMPCYRLSDLSPTVTVCSNPNDVLIGLVETTQTTLYAQRV